jgi:hypothetical protein
MTTPGNPSLISPSNLTPVFGNIIVFSFTVPTDADNDKLVFRLEIDTNSPIDINSARYKFYESRFALDKRTYGKWQVKDSGGNWIDLPIGGVDSSFYGRDARIIIRKQEAETFPDVEGNWYWRISASDGMLRNPVYNRVVFGQAIFGDIGA